MTHRPSSSEIGWGACDRLGVDPKMPVEISDRAGLAKMFYAEGRGPVTDDTAKPGEGRRMSINHSNQQAVAWNVAQQALNLASCRVIAALAGALRGMPTGVEAIS